MKNQIDYYLEQVEKTACKLKEQQKEIQRFIDFLRLAREEKKQVFICGNGGSAGTAVHMACDLFKIAGIRAISLTENVPLMTAIINDDGWENLYTEQLKRLHNPGDMIIAISVHGGSGSDKAGLWSQNLTKAIDYVSTHGGITLGFSGFDGGAMKTICNVCVVVPAETTPLVESFHMVLEHLIAFELQVGDRI
jgi:D-sedoheptulose 7-phosphate isomerase